MKKIGLIGYIGTILGSERYLSFDKAMEETYLDEPRSLPITKQHVSSRRIKHPASIMSPNEYGKHCKERTVVGRNDLCPCGSGLKFKKCKCKEHHK
jgi:hypothetical protein